jgi:hypothetical protein
MTAGHYAPRAWRAGHRAGAGGCGALALALLLVFAPWPGQLWSDVPAGAGDFTSGLIWAGPNSPTSRYQLFGDQPWFAEYHWHGLQNIAGNAYVLAGLALLVLLTVIALRTRHAVAVRPA